MLQGDGGPSGSRAEVSRRLKNAMASRGWMQADLVKHSGLAKATVSDALKGERTPSTSTLEALVDALGFVGAERAELFRFREAGEDRVRRLDEYLTAALRAAHDHPYAGVLPGVMPPLADVYVGLRVEGGTSVEVRLAVDGPQPALEVLAAHGTCVLRGGPGGGKSSVLRALLGEIGTRWRGGRGGAEVPVLVSAASLTQAPLAQALAEAVNANLAGHGLVEPLPGSFFAHPPKLGARWLVLVDGFDEVPDRDKRRTLAAMIAAIRAGARSSEYRFVLATRPLPDEELSALDSGVPRYDLLPFGSVDVAKVAEGWLRALGVQEPERVSGEFMRALASSHLESIARIPLMTSMLCQVFAADPARPLPNSRGHLYREFVSLLREHASPHRAAALRAECESLARYSQAAREAAESVASRVDVLSASIAYELCHGLDVPVVVLAAALTEADRPAEVPDLRWQAFLSAALRADGVLAAQADDLRFPHQTVLEYFAARHATALLAPPSDRFTLELYGYGFKDSSGVHHGSYAGFMLDQAHETTPDAWSAYFAPPRMMWLRRLFPQDWQLSSGFALQLWARRIVAQAKLGTTLPEDLPTTVHEAFRAELDDFPARYICKFASLRKTYLGACAETLAWLNSPIGWDLLCQLIRNGHYVSDMALMKWGGARFADRLREISLDGELRDGIRVLAATRLSEIDDTGAADVLRLMLVDGRLAPASRMTVMAALAKLIDAETADRAAEALYAVAADEAQGSATRVAAAVAVAELGDRRTAELLEAFALDASFDEYLRLGAATARSTHGDERPDGLWLQAMGVDDGGSPYHRRREARELSNLADEHALESLRSIAFDVSLAISERIPAAEELARIGDGEALSFLRSSLSALRPRRPAKGTAWDSKLRLAVSLAKLGDPYGIDVLRAFITGHKNDLALRLELIDTLKEVSYEVAGEALYAIASNDQVHGLARLCAAESLVRRGDTRAADSLHTLVTSNWLSSLNRRRAASVLVEINDPRGADSVRLVLRQP